MQENLTQSIRVAKKLLEYKQKELELLEFIIESGDSLNDDLLAEICEMTYKIKVAIGDLQKMIASLEEQFAIFGEFGVEKHFDRLTSIDQPTDEISEIQQLRRNSEKTTGR